MGAGVDGQPTQWVPGHNNPLVYRGRGGGVCNQARLLVANLLWHVRRNGVVAFASAMPASGGKQGEKAAHHSVVAHLLGISHQTVRDIEANLDSIGSKFVQHRRRARARQGGEQKSNKRARILQESTSKLASGNCGDSYFLKLSPSHYDEDMDSIDMDFEVRELASGSHLRRRSQLEQWREHTNYMPGMTHAELSAFWITTGLPATRWPGCLEWFRSRAPPSTVVDINCSFHWVQEFSTSLSKTMLSHSAASIHSMVPALGIPSDLVRIIDVVTIGPGVSTLPIIFVHTSHEGKLVFSIVACPTLGGQPAAGGSNQGSQLASGSMRSHSAPQLVDLVHKCEARMYVHRDDRVLRLAMTMADGAIQGPGSTRFEEQEAEVDRRNVRHVGVCQFHRLDNAGSMTDRQFPAAALFDRFLRLIRQGFAFGTGTTIMRAVADKFDVLAKELDAKATELRDTAGHCQQEGRCKQAARLNREADREAAHAASLRRCGWTTYRRPLAPNVDGTRKVVWQSHARRRVFEIFAIIYWSLQVRMVGVREQARLDAERKRPASGGKSDRIGE